LKSGNFEQTNQLLGRAATMSKDPAVQQMASWINQFESQRQVFAAERHKQYEKSVADVRKLVDKQKEAYALEVAARAHERHARRGARRTGFGDVLGFRRAPRTA